MTMPLIALALVGATTSAPPEMPWLHGLDELSVTDEPQADVADRMPTNVEDYECATSATHGLALVADVTPSAGMETVLASYAQGIVVLDHEEHVVASAAGYECQASADEITSLAAGRAFRAPTIALAITRGGHEEQTTELVLYRVGLRGRLDPVFTGVVEEHLGEDVRAGAVWLIPGGLIHQRLDGKRALWTYDELAGVYQFRGTLGAESPPLA